MYRFNGSEHYERAMKYEREKSEDNMMLAQTSKDSFIFFKKGEYFELTEEKEGLFKGVILLDDEPSGIDQALEAIYYAEKTSDGYRLMVSTYYRFNFRTEQRNLLTDIYFSDDDLALVSNRGYTSTDLTFSLIIAMEELANPTYY